MAQRSSKTRQANKTDPASEPDLTIHGADQITSEAGQASAGQRDRKAVALSMALPGARLEMALGGSHPLLVELVRHLARAAARDEHAMQSAAMNARRTPRG